jgi:hypothetical protein
MFKKILAILFLLSLAAACCSASLAEGTVKIGKKGIDNMKFAGLLPDGRMVFGGRLELGSDAGTKARLLCLNPDGTISWEYVDQVAKYYYKTVVTDEGTIAVLQPGSVRIFSADGKYTGREIPIHTPLGYIYELTTHGLLTEAKELTGWDGSVLFTLPASLMAQVHSLIPEEDGLVLMGGESYRKGFEPPAKIMKVDWQGKTQWEKTLPLMAEDERAWLQKSFRTDDGCYLVLHEQSVFHPDTEQMSYFAELIKFNVDGEILWTKRADDSGENPDMIYTDIAEYNGKYVVFCRKQGQSFYPGILLYLWLDSDGNELGTIRRSVSKEDIPELAAGRNVNSSLGQLIATKEGLWQSITFWDEDLNNEKKTEDSMQQVLLPIPVL